MKKSDAKVGTKVLASFEIDENENECISKYHYDKYDDDILEGIILDKKSSKPNCVWVKWTKGNFEDEEDMVSIDLLTLKSERYKIEQEFKIVAKEIKAKMQQAAKFVKEAGKLAKTINADLSIMDASDPLVDVMDKFGWHSSSWGC